MEGSWVGRVHAERRGGFGTEVWGSWERAGAAGVPWCEMQIVVAFLEIR